MQYSQTYLIMAAENGKTNDTPTQTSASTSSQSYGSKEKSSQPKSSQSDALSLSIENEFNLLAAFSKDKRTGLSKLEQSMQEGSRK